MWEEFREMADSFDKLELLRQICMEEEVRYMQPTWNFLEVSDDLTFRLGMHVDHDHKWQFPEDTTNNSFWKMMIYRCAWRILI